MKTDYTKLDDAIIEQITRQNLASFSDILRDIGTMAGDIGPKLRIGQTDGFRVIDRRLQAMSKAGRIKYDRRRGAWVLAGLLD